MLGERLGDRDSLIEGEILLLGLTLELILGEIDGLMLCEIDSLIEGDKLGLSEGEIL
jgi:hypothetical protein